MYRHKRCSTSDRPASMSSFPARSSQKKILWLAAVTLLYIFSIVRFDFLQGPPMWDEIHYWETSLLFSDDLMPTLSSWQQYGELSTPLPFVIFGGLEYLFGQGIFAGRLLSLILFMVIAFIVGWPTAEREDRSLRCLVGLCLCNSYLALNGRLYTEMITCTFVLLGFVGYVKQKHVLSALAFIAAIACRQYMIVFPAAIACCEFIATRTSSTKQSSKQPIEQQTERSPQLNYWAIHKRWILPAIATLSLLIWIYLFKGLAPAWILHESNTPGVQKTIFAIDPGGAIHSLAAVGAYIVIPEILLFKPKESIRKLLKPQRKIAIIAAVLLFYMILFPPVLNGLGRLIKTALMLPHPFLAMVLFYVLALLACIRFSEFSLMAVIVLFQTIIMTKAYPWDKYVLPVAVAFWYLKSYKLEQIFSLSTFSLPTGTRTPPTNEVSTAPSSSELAKIDKLIDFNSHL